VYGKWETRLATGLDTRRQPMDKMRTCYVSFELQGQHREDCEWGVCQIGLVGDWLASWEPAGLEARVVLAWVWPTLECLTTRISPCLTMALSLYS
jgi:hypothetical protein